MTNLISPPLLTLLKCTPFPPHVLCPPPPRRSLHRWYPSLHRLSPRGEQRLNTRFGRGVRFLVDLVRRVAHLSKQVSEWVSGGWHT